VNEKKSLYIESTIPSYATGRTGRDAITAGNQASTKRFWEEERHKYELVTSQFTVDECSLGDPEAARKRLEFLSGIHVLPKTNEIVELGMFYKQFLNIPTRAETDCLHLAVCVLNCVDYLLTWNFTHLGIASQMKAKEYNDTHGLWTPILVTTESIHGFMRDNI
jgi:hypothetical protein